MKASHSIQAGQSPPPPDSAEYDEVVDLLRATLADMQVAYLFGSRAHKRTHPESDFDLAVLTPRPLSSEVRWELQEELASLLHAEVDLVDLAGASTVMRMQVVTTGTVLFERERFVRDEFEMRTLSAYALLNEERAALLKHVQKRGRVYGR